MIWNHFKTYYHLAEESLNGTYGWFWEISTICFVVLLFNFGFKRILQKLQDYFERHQQIGKQSFVKALYEPFSYYIWFFVALEMMDFFTLQLFKRSYMPEKQMILAIGLVIMMTWFLLRWKSNIVMLLAYSNAHAPKLDMARRDVLDKVVTVVIFLVAAMLLLEITGSNLNTLVAFGGISGLAIAFASQEVIASFFGGLMIYLNHPFVIGDWVILPERNIEGHIEEIGWYTTKVRTFEKRPIYVPNSIFSKIVVVNPSRMTHRRIKETIGIRYNDIGELKSIIADLKEMLANDSNIDQSLRNEVYFETFGTFSLNVTLIAYTKGAISIDFNRIKEEILFKVIDVLHKHQAEVAFPTTRIEIPGQVKLTTSNDLHQALSA